MLECPNSHKFGYNAGLECCAYSVHHDDNSKVK